MKNPYTKLSQINGIPNFITAVIALIDSDLNIIDSNITFEEVLKKKVSLKQTLSETSKKLIEELIKRNPAVLSRNPVEVSFCTANGTIWIQGYITRIQQKRFIFCGQDITNSKKDKIELIRRNEELENVKNAVLNLLEDMTQAQESLKSANKELRQLDELKNEFISIASHELRTPMTSIKGYISMVLDGDAGEINKEVRTFLMEVYKSNERLVELVNDMLDVSKIEQKRLRFDIKKVEALPVIKEAFERMKPIAEDDSDNLILKTNIDENLKIAVDSKRYQQVIQNLVENAIKFTEKGNIIIETKVDGKYLVTSIEDDGMGIPEESIGKLFQKFYQVSQVLNRPKGGSGLGLYISKNIIEGMGGKIWVKSKLGSGSKFSFSIPLARKNRNR